MKKRLHLLFPLCFLALLSVAVFGQSFEPWNIPFSVDGTTLANPLAGGLNAPQFSSMDLNRDSVPDLMVFDRSGNILLTYLRDKDDPAVLTYAPEYEVQFPALVDWVLFRDYNQDGVEDIFTYSTLGAPGFDVYRGSYADGTFSYEKLIFNNPTGVLGYPTSSGAIANIYCTAADMPAVVDVDGDEDLDILSFQSDGTKVFFYKNLSVEQGFGTDSLDFILADRCWGKIVESFNSNDVVLSDDPETCPVSLITARHHGGSTVTTFDVNFDGDQDLLLGDLTYETILFLENGGTPDAAFMTAQQQNFPDYDVSVFIPFFPATYIQDFDGDSLVDMIAAPNQKDARENIDVAWRYQGVVQDGKLEFRFQRSDLLVCEMLDFGTDASPLFFDYNGDGVQDLVVGSRFHKDYDPDYPSSLFLFENTGTNTSPDFTLIDDNWLQLETITEEVDALAPTASDIDGDGDLDLIVGNKRGKLFYIENIGIFGGPFEPGEIVYPWFDIDVGFSSVPAVADADQDGVKDLLIGEERGNINFIRNLGSAISPVFNPDLSSPENSEDFGAIDAGQNLAVFGLAGPTTFISEGEEYLLVGSAPGNFLLYNMADNLLENAGIPMDSELNNLKDGERSRATIHDLDANGYLDILVGSSRGGLTLYRTSMRSDQIVPTRESKLASIDMQLYPNPAGQRLFVKTNDNSIQSVKIYSRTGQVITTWEGKRPDVSFDVQNLEPGIYVMTVYTDKGTATRNWVKF